jgi:predicted fused transcriptional regulator/phosphomethylpyrimidine kinase
MSINGMIMKNPDRERSDALEKLEKAVAILEQSMDVRLIPADGTKLGYAIRGARDKEGVAAVQGGITQKNKKPHLTGLCAFGVDEDISRMILTTMKFDPRMRCAATLRFSGKVLVIIESLLLECSSFDPASAQPGISTMDWGVASCCKKGVPDVCFDTGGNGKEAIIRLFGEEPNDVSNNIIMISNRIITIEL